MIAFPFIPFLISLAAFSIVSGDVHEYLNKGTDEVRSEVNNNETPYDLFICLDCADPMRLGFSSSVFENAKETVCIDHSNSHIKSFCRFF